MTELSDAVLQHVPYLRRHARLLAGSQEVGDEYVRICLELVLAEPERLRGGPFRVQLFKAFHAAWEAVAETIRRRPSPESMDLEERLEQGLAGLAPLERRVLLLVVVEGFAYEEVAQILELDLEQVRELLGRARHDLRSRVSVSVLIIEDQSLIAMDLARIMEEMGHTVAGFATREKTAVQEAEQARPGLVLCDIRLLDDESGINAAQKILQRYDVPVVFVTGYPEMLLTGGRLEPAFVVPKPFNDDALKVTVSQALATYASPEKGAAHKKALLEKLSRITGTSLEPPA